MRKFLLLTVMCVLGFIGTLRAQGGLLIVETGADQNPDYSGNFNLPVYDYNLLLKHIYSHVEGEVAQSCPTLCDSMDCSPRGSSIHGIF